MKTSEPLDPDLAAIVRAMAERGAPRAFAGSISEARARFEKAVRAAASEEEMPKVGAIRDIAPDTDAGRIPMRVYTPENGETGAVVAWFHGGGYALGSLDLFDESARRLCCELDSTVVAVGYRRSPEHPYPAPFDDAVAATQWVARHAETLGGDPRLVAVAGESAGGNLAACAAIAMRDRKVPLAGQLLIVPGVNLAREIAPDAVFPMLQAADLADIRDNLMGPGADVAQCPPSPIFAADLGGVAPAVIAVAGHDPLRAEGMEYAERLREAGVDTELLRFDTMHHTFFGFARASKGANMAVRTLCAAFRRRLAMRAGARFEETDHDA
jgi:acetyl esterase